MTAFAADIRRYPLRHAKVQSAKIRAQVRITAGGFAAFTFSYDPSMTVVATATGTYALTFPATQGNLHYYMELVHFGASPNIAFVYPTVMNPSAGALTFVTTAVGAPFTPVFSTETGIFLINMELTIDQKKPN